MRMTRAGPGGAEADREHGAERDRHLAEGVPRVPLADDALDPVDELDRLDPALQHGEQRALGALVRRVLARHEGDVRGQPRELLDLRGREPREERDLADLFRGHHADQPNDRRASAGAADRSVTPAPRARLHAMPTKLPDLSLPDQGGAPRSLSELAGGDPLILHTFRGHWCPKEQRFFRRLVALQDELEVGYARLASLSVDPPEVNAAFRSGLGARWTFLSDADRSAQSRLGLRETTDTVHAPYVPRVYVLLPDLTVAAEYDGYWYWGRPTTGELVRELRAATRRIRPDYDAPTA